MKKILIPFLILMMALTLSSCGTEKLSGTYVSKEDRSVSMEFKKNNIVVFSDRDSSLEGYYYFEFDDYVTVLFPEKVNWPIYKTKDASKQMTFEIVNNKTLELNFISGTAASFVKKGFFARHWKKILIGFLALGVISVVYKFITGRELEDDLDRLNDKIEDSFNK